MSEQINPIYTTKKEEPSLVTELLTTLKHTIRNLWITIIILVMLLFLSNIIWLYAWNLPAETNIIEQENIDSSTVTGEINNGVSEN